MKTKILVLVIALAFVMGCKRDAISEVEKGDFKLQFLFEVDGCKMYRFYDGRWIYWADCRGKVNSDYETTTQNGKNTTHTEHYVEAITSK